jgi:hypothetical protein
LLVLQHLRALNFAGAGKAKAIALHRFDGLSSWPAALLSAQALQARRRMSRRTGLAERRFSLQSTPATDKSARIATGSPVGRPKRELRDRIDFRKDGTA